MYYTMSDLVNMGRVPYDLAVHLLWDCPLVSCRYPILYNENLTSAKCSNPFCPGHLAQRANAVFKALNYKGLGEVFAQDLIIQYHLKHHLDIFNKDFVEALPNSNDKNTLFKNYVKTPVSIDFYKIFTFLYIPHIQEQWYSIVGNATTLEQVYNRNKPDNLTKVQWVIIQNNLKKLNQILYLFNIRYQRAISTLEIMITGGVENFNNKDEFINYLNVNFGDKFNFKQVGVKKSSHICICDSISSNSRKYKVAKMSGIPVTTSDNLINLLRNGAL